MSDSPPDPYRVIGVDKTAAADEIKKKYRALARKLHPDRGGDPDKLKIVNAAYEILGDDEKRKLFDEFGHAAFRPGFDAVSARRYKNAGFGGMGGGGGFDIEDIMRMFGGGSGGRPGGFGHRGPRRGQDLQASLTVSLSEALEGSQREFRASGGKSVTVRIPKGVRSGQRLRVAAKGSPGIDGGPAGDLLLEVAVAEHALVQVDRDDLVMEVPLTFLESLKGGAITLPTPTGSVKVKIPARAESGTRMRLKGRGLPRGGKGTRTGDLYLVLMPTPPDTEPADDSLEAVEAAYTRDVRAALTFE